jgi:hypothetical protein
MRARISPLLIASNFLLAACLAGCPSPTSETPDAGTDAPIPGDAGTDAFLDRDAAPEQPITMVQTCPGPGCMTNDEGLQVGAGARTITPEPGTYDLAFNADGSPITDGSFDVAEGDRIEDTNGNGMRDAAWIAGFGLGRPARGIENDQWARAIALRNGETTIVFCSIDAVGYFINEMDRVRDMLPASLGVDYVFFSATHVHEAEDTIGIWGEDFSSTGRRPAHLEAIRTQAAAAITEAVMRLQPATVDNVTFRLSDIDQDLTTPGIQPEVRRFVGDNRDPFIFDDQVRMLRFRTADGSNAPGTPPTPDASGSRAAAGPSTSTIATLINFAAHPEYEGSRQTEVSSDIGHWLRTTVEQGADGPDADTEIDTPGVGGIAVYVNGALGVQIGPNRLDLRDFNGAPVAEDNQNAARHVGSLLGYYALRALNPMDDLVARRTTLDASMWPISFRRGRFYLRVQNTLYQIGFSSGLFDREVYNYDPARTIDFRRDRNLPELYTELAIIRVGPVEFFTMPGELDPILFVGTRGERAYTPPSYNGGNPVDTTRTNPPILPSDEIPHVMQLRDADVDESDVWLLGLTGDFLGYFVADYDYELNPAAPFIAEAEGDHYEETNSLGPEAWPRVWRNLTQLHAAR